MLFVSKETREARLDTCRTCEHFVAATQSCGPLVTEAFTDSKLCGCHMPTKTRLKVAKCPLDKWGPTLTKADVRDALHIIENMEHHTNEDLVQMHNKITGGHKNRTNCAPCNRSMLNDLKKFVTHAQKQQN